MATKPTYRNVLFVALGVAALAYAFSGKPKPPLAPGAYRAIWSGSTVSFTLDGHQYVFDWDYTERGPIEVALWIRDNGEYYVTST